MTSNHIKSISYSIISNPGIFRYHSYHFHSIYHSHQSLPNFIFIDIFPPLTHPSPPPVFAVALAGCSMKLFRLWIKGEPLRQLLSILMGFSFQKKNGPLGELHQKWGCFFFKILLGGSVGRNKILFNLSINSKTTEPSISFLFNLNDGSFAMDFCTLHLWISWTCDV